MEADAAATQEEEEDDDEVCPFSESLSRLGEEAKSALIRGSVIAFMRWSNNTRSSQPNLEPKISEDYADAAA
jgi:hypothetical protein